MARATPAAAPARYASTPAVSSVPPATASAVTDLTDADDVFITDSAPPSEAAEALAKLWEAMPQRDDPAVLAQLEADVAALLADHGDDYQVLVSACVLKYWLADGADEAAKEALGKEMWALAEHALEQAPDGPEAHLCLALGVGTYAEGAGILAAILQGLEGKFLEPLQKVIQEAPDLLYGAPLVVMGRYYQTAPWPKQDLDEAARWYRKAIAAHPENLRASLFLAQTLVEQGATREAKKLVQQVLAGDVGYDPPEAKRVQALAEELRRQHRALR